MRTMLPISVEPRAKANMTGRQPPWVNSLDVGPVARLRGVADARAVRATMRSDWVYMVED